MDNFKQQIADSIKGANNVLIAVSRDPSVDQLSSAIGLALFLNKLNKHATAVFSGAVPSTIEFLDPGKTLEKNTDSLRDFIIALDKVKADKLRYKVEDDHVKIFITPYRTSITQEDLNFSQGDFNVDVVVALGVREQNDLDQAITAHGRILHDATVLTVSLTPTEGLGSINWVNPTASSLCEMVTELSDTIKADNFDAQMATALLTGIVAETSRFSNEKTTSTTMSMSAKLLAAGANQQLVADSLQPKPEPVPEPAPEEPDVQPEEEIESKGQSEGADQQPQLNEDVDGLLTLPPLGPAQRESSSDGALIVSHEDLLTIDKADQDIESEEEVDKELDQIHISDDGQIISLNKQEPLPTFVPEGSRLMTEPPSMGGTLTASSQVDGVTTTSDPMSQPGHDRPLLSHDNGPSDKAADNKVAFDPMAYITTDLPTIANPAQPAAEPTTESPQDSAPIITDISDDGPAQTLQDLEQAVSSSHAAEITDDHAAQQQPQASADLASLIPTAPLPDVQKLPSANVATNNFGSPASAPAVPPPLMPPNVPGAGAPAVGGPFPPAPQNPIGM